MNPNTRTAHSNALLCLLLGTLLPGPLLLGGCDKSAPAEKATATAKKDSAAAGKAPDAADEAGKDKEKDKGSASAATGTSPGEPAAEEGVSLKPEEVEKMGIETTALLAAKHAPETSGYGVVMSHETIAQGVADLATAVAVERQSQAAFKRSKGLAGTPGAVPTDALEAAERQALVDQAALQLQRRRLSSMFGQNPPWKSGDDSPELTRLATGRSQLVRVTFPLGTIGEADPAELRLAHLSGGVGAKTWTSSAVWRAPADASVPGKSYFALLRGGDFGEGERVLAYAPIGEPEDGVMVPADAVVITAGKYWYYVEEKPGVFVRTELQASTADDAGYFVKEGASAGDKVVTSAAGQLLARDLNPSKEAE